MKIIKVKITIIITTTISLLWDTRAVPAFNNPQEKYILLASLLTTPR